MYAHLFKSFSWILCQSTRCTPISTKNIWYQYFWNHEFHCHLTSNLIMDTGPWESPESCSVSSVCLNFINCHCDWSEIGTLLTSSNQHEKGQIRGEGTSLTSHKWPRPPRAVASSSPMQFFLNQHLLLKPATAALQIAEVSPHMVSIMGCIVG